MNNSNLARVFKTLQSTVAKHSPEILTGIGIAGMISATVLAVKATPKALSLIEDKKEELRLDAEDNLTPVETVQTTWKCYIPAAVTGVAAAACLIGATSVNNRRNAALATAYNLSTTALADYKSKVVETIGPRKEREIREAVADEQIKREPVDKSTVIITNTGTTRFYDDISKRRFTSDIETIRRIVNNLNADMLDGDDYVSLNTFYYEIGLEPTSFGDELGWNVSRDGRRDGMIRVDFHAKLESDGQPSIVLDYAVAPKRGFDSYR